MEAMPVPACSSWTRAVRCTLVTAMFAGALLLADAATSTYAAAQTPATGPLQPGFARSAIDSPSRT